MGRRTEVRQIGENRYRVTQLKVRKANRVLERLLATAAPLLGAAGDNLGATGDALAGDLGKESLADVGMQLTKLLDGDQVNWLIGEVIGSVEYQTEALKASTPEGFVPMTMEIWDDSAFSDLMEQFRLLAFVLELNFSGFFAGLGGLKDAARRFVTPSSPRSESPKTATPGSGA